ncbi:site-specific recombinase XerD [Sanguibacter keddieii DSM 10542]|uniref:Site-specific recombinase XerD n=1 Tax=Sanguibacter keddieii (strain ATCC 51767 / DSM 10542 / NCFB 3025 / ST-74) TaxID=446469 RepID=D1BBK2_SANKS|nr:site-specific recombinase XerD [Sanguibacter keddieii DSM 10542]
MSVRRTPSGRWQVRVKDGRRDVASKTFDTKRSAQAWEAEQKAKLSGGAWVDPKAGRTPVREVIDEYLATRPGIVSSKTLLTEHLLLGKVTPALGRLPVSAVTREDVQTDLGVQALGLATSSVKRYRGILSALFTYSVARRLRETNPVSGTKLPSGAEGHERTEMAPYTLEELREVAAACMEQSPDGDITLFLGLTGLRWGEMAALRVKDVLEVPRRAIRVSRSAPTGHAIRETTKGGRDRFVPLVEDVWQIVARRMVGRAPDDLLFVNPSGRIWGGWNWKCGVSWAQHARGRRVHDLRHTAATLWLSSGVPPKTVQAWLGHSTATMTLDLYAHYLPASEADAGLRLMNERLAGGARGDRPAEQLTRRDAI